MTFDNAGDNPNAENNLDKREDASNTSDKDTMSYEELQKRLDEVIKGTNKVMEENARLREAFSSISKSDEDSESDDEVFKTKQVLNEMGFADKDYIQETIEGRLKKLESKKELDEILSSIPEISGQRVYIEKIKELEPDKSWEDIISETGLIDKAKIAAAQSQYRFGNAIPKSEGTNKPSLMDDDKYEKWLDSNSPK